MKEQNYPPYTLTNMMINYISDITRKITEIDYLNLDKKPELRKQNRINSIYSSLAIEKNPLSRKQVEDIIDGKIVMGKQKDIQEVKNAYMAYERISSINPYSVEELKNTHGIMTFLIQEDNGKYRNHGEAVYNGDKMIFLAPPHNRVPELMDNLFEWMNNSKNTVHPLILSSVFHYEFVFIHPFSDGNGRMARLWQTAILSKWNVMFEYMPIENIIKRHQQEYYKTINECDKIGNSTRFIEFMLKIIDETIEDLLKRSKNSENNETESLNITEKEALDYIYINELVSTKELAEYLGKADRTARRIVSLLIEKGLITYQGRDKNDPNIRYKKMSE